MDLDSVADELYGAPPEEFVRLRDERARQARSSGDREFADRIRELRRPNKPAWLVNLLVRERPDDVRQLLDLAAALGEAQQQLDPEAMRRLGSQRHQVVRALGREAAGLASSAGAPVTGSVQREVEQTLEAALSDPAAADAIRGGRLTTALTYAGLGAFDTGPARPAKDDAKPAPQQERRTGPSSARSAADRKALSDARQEVAAAQRDATASEQDAARAAEAARAAARERDEQQARIQHLEQQLAEARDALQAANQSVRDAERRQRSCEQVARSAKRRLDQARAQLDALSRP